MGKAVATFGDITETRCQTVLVVDDVSANLAVVADNLTRHGFRIRVAHTGQAALKIALRTRPDLILLDVQLPDLDGFEVCRRLKADDRTFEIPVIFMTVMNQTEDKVRGFDVGGVDYITKPVQHEEVLARVTTHLRLRELTRKLEESKESLEQRVIERTSELAQTNLSLRKEIVERQQMEVVLQHLNRELRAISDCNQVLVRAVNEQELLNDVCRIVCEEAGYRMAWVGFPDSDEAKTIRPVAWAGHHDGYLTQSRISWDDSPHGQGPGGTAIRTGEIASIDDFAADPCAVPWRDAALQLGFRSLISLPLKDDFNQVFGIFNIYSSTANAFPKEEQRLLQELAGDLAFGIVTLRRRLEHEKVEEQIEHLAYHDPLTQLPNRRLLLSRLEQALVENNHESSFGALLFVDLDNFKILNDTRGHVVGDQLLIEVAQRLTNCVGTQDTIARVGGDEFMVLLENLGNSTEAGRRSEGVAEHILHELNEPYFFDEHEHHNTLSVGIALFCGARQSLEEIMKQADIALYQAKKDGRNTLRFFDPELEAALAARATLEMALRRAIEQQQFFLHYQPQFDRTRGLIGAELLIRWHHPERGLVSPAEFIPLAEESGLILPIGQWILDTACSTLKQWAYNPHTRELDLAINVSHYQFRQPDFVDQVRLALQKSGAPPNRLKIELTESLLIDDIEGSIQKMHALKALGVFFSLDDFGTGYSSLSYLTRLPLEQLKIDMSFVRNLPHNHNDAIVAQAIINLAKSLELSVIAEGVETESQRAFLEEHGCTAYQGYLFSTPVPLEDFEHMVGVGH